MFSLTRKSLSLRFCVMIGVCVRRGMASRLTGFMRVAHLLPRQSGNVAVDNYRFVNALLWMCRTGAPWRDLPEC